MTKRELVRIIKRAFQTAPMPAPENVMQMVSYVADHPSVDAEYVWKDLAGKRWEDLTADEIVSPHAAFSMMTPEAVRYYLPAYLILVIERPQDADMEVDKTIWSLSPPPFGHGSFEDFHARVSLFSPLERTAIAYFFEYMRRNVEFFSGDGDYGRVTCYWLKDYSVPLPVELRSGGEDPKPLRARSRYIRKRTLIHEIRAAFAGAAMPTRDTVFREDLPSAGAAIDIFQELDVSRWELIKSSDIRRLDGALSMMTPKAFQYYLPAFLIHVLQEPQSIGDALKSTVWSLSPPPVGMSSEQEFDERINLLTLPQILTIADFFLYLRTTEYYLCQFLGDEPHQHLMVDFWNIHHNQKSKLS